jgi:hypothetical protein
MSLTMIERDRVVADHGRAFESITAQMAEAAKGYGSEQLIAVAWFLFREDNAVKLRALVADRDDFDEWMGSDMQQRPFSFFIEAQTEVH